MLMGMVTTAVRTCHGATLSTTSTGSATIYQHGLVSDCHWHGMPHQGITDGKVCWFDWSFAVFSASAAPSSRRPTRQADLVLHRSVLKNQGCCLAWPSVAGGGLRGGTCTLCVNGGVWSQPWQLWWTVVRGRASVAPKPGVELGW